MELVGGGGAAERFRTGGMGRKKPFVCCGVKRHSCVEGKEKKGGKEKQTGNAKEPKKKGEGSEKCANVDFVKHKWKEWKRILIAPTL